jgi:glucose/arabinose dehydrogenase
MKRKYLVLFCLLPFCFKTHAQAYIINTFAGDHVAGYSGDGFAATSAELNQPWGVAVDRAGNVYIAEYNNHRIRKVSTTGIITTVAGNGTNGFSGDGFAATSAQLNFPTGVAVDSAGNIYIADEDNQRIRKVNTAGIISTYAGSGGVGFS